MSKDTVNEGRTGEDGNEKEEVHKALLERYQTTSTVMIPREVFESLYLTPYMKTEGRLRNTFGNPTPMPLMGFLIASMPLGCHLMGWRGSGGGGAAIIGSFFFFGGMLQILGSVLEWILGNTFPFIVFGCYGAFWLSTALTLQPAFNAETYYTSAGDTAQFYASYSFFYMVMALVTFFFLIGALRTNVVFVLVFFFVDVSFIMLMASYWTTAEGKTDVALKCQKAAGAFIFVFCVFGWYLFFGMVVAAADLPFSLPTGDLSTRIKGASERKKQQTAEEKV